MKHAYNFKDITGQKFGSWIVLYFLEIRFRPNHTRKSIWHCRCICGKEKDIHSSSLFNGDSTSCGCQKGLKEGQASSNRVFYQYKKNAANRELVWRISRKEFDSFVCQPCFYCENCKENSYQSSSRAKGRFHYTGIDRVDNSKGYVLENIVPCCQTCNRAKYKMNVNDFLCWIEKIHAVQKIRRGKIK